MKTSTILVSIAATASVFLLAAGSTLNRPVVDVEEPTNWEQLHEASTKLRKVMKQCSEKLRALLLFTDESGFGAIMAEGINQSALYLSAVLDTIDTKIQAKTKLDPDEEQFLEDSYFDQKLVEIEDIYIFAQKKYALESFG